jgi:hypothetical protein
MQINVPASFAEGVIRTKTSLPANIYLIARHYDTNGSGFCALRDINNTLKVSGRSLSIIKSAMALDDFSLYFRGIDTTKGLLYYHNMGVVLANLNVVRVKNGFASINIIEATRSKAAFTANMYAVWLSAIHGPISRETITNVLNVTVPAQRKWEKALGITVEHVFINGTPEALNQLNLIPCIDGKYLFIKNADNTISVQTANKYHTALDAYKLKVRYRRIARKHGRTNRTACVVQNGMTSNGPVKPFFYTDESYSNLRTPPTVATVFPYEKEYTATGGTLAYLQLTADPSIALRQQLGLA